MSNIFAAKHNLRGGGRTIELVGLDSEAALPARFASGIAEFDRAIGGGIVAGLGDAGRRRSRASASRPCCSRSARRLAAQGQRVVYVSGEESAEQVRLRAVRLGLGKSPVQLAAATSVRDILTTLARPRRRRCW